MAKILVIRFSAIGDVAMTIPVIYSFAVQYPQHQITVLSRNTLAPLFDGLPPNITFHGVDLKGEHAGIMGLEWIYKDLKKEHFDAVADFHDVLRSKYLRIRFRLAGVKVAHLDKGRSGKRKLVRARNKVMEWQKSSFQRYAEVFRNIGYPVKLNFQSLFGKGKGNISCMQPLTGDKGTDKWIGIAPFAAHVGKIYPLSKQEQVISLLSERKNTKILLFGVDTDDVTEEEIISMVNEGHEQGVLQANEAEMIHNIFEFGDKDAKDIMVHRKNIIAIDGTMTFLEMLDFTIENNYSRYPVYIDDIDNIIGVLHINLIVIVWFVPCVWYCRQEYSAT